MDAPLQCFGMGQDGKDEVWVDGRDRWKNGHEKRPNEKYGRDKTEV